MADVSTREISLHGNRVSYRCGGTARCSCSSTASPARRRAGSRVLPALAEHFTILAPDLLGHGQSDKPAGDYSLGSHACIVRDLMLALGHERGTIIGHSLGGGIAMQVAYQFPELVGRLVLVASGGLGREVSVFLRAVTLPGLGARAAADRLSPRARRRRRRLACARPDRAAGRLGPRRDRARHRVAQRARRPPRVRAHRALGDRPRRPARRRPRPALPRRGGPVAARVGRDRPDHPGRARPPRARADAGQPARAVRARRALPAPR